MQSIVVILYYFLQSTVNKVYLILHMYIGIIISFSFFLSSSSIARPALWANVVAGRKLSVSKPIPGTSNVIFPRAPSSSQINRSTSQTSTNSRASQSVSSSSFATTKSQQMNSTTSMASTQSSNHLSNQNHASSGVGSSKATRETEGSPEASKVVFDLGGPEDAASQSGATNSSESGFGERGVNITYADACRSHKADQRSGNPHNAYKDTENKQSLKGDIRQTQKTEAQNSFRGRWDFHRGRDQERRSDFQYVEPQDPELVHRIRSEPQRSTKELPDNYQYRRAFSGIEANSRQRLAGNIEKIPVKSHTPRDGEGWNRDNRPYRSNYSRERVKYYNNKQ